MTETKQKSDLSRAFSEDGELKTHVGGQALLEGIMMRGKYNWSVAVREPQGTIYLEERDLASGKDKNGWLYWPFIRGCRAFVESLTLGYKALSIAAEHAYLEDDDNAAESSPEPSGVVGAQEGSAQKLDPLSKDNVVDDPRSLRSAPLGPDDTCSPDAEESPSHDFSWKRDFGHPDEMIDALGAQRTLEVVAEPAVL